MCCLQGGNVYSNGSLISFGGRGTHITGIFNITGHGMQFYVTVGEQGLSLGNCGKKGHVEG